MNAGIIKRGVYVAAALIAAMSTSALGLTINFSGLGGLSGDQSAAIQRAGASWEAILGDNITVDIAIVSEDIAGSALASASMSLFGASFNTVRQTMISDATGTAVESILPYLPTSGQYQHNSLSGFDYGDNIDVSYSYIYMTTANYNALFGVNKSGDDGTITFDSSQSWDLDNSNGVTGNAYDFESVMLHEIGHVLGFSSFVDRTDTLLADIDEYTFYDTYISTVDLFRFERTDAPTSAAGFTTATRDIAPGGDDVFYTEAALFDLSTGENFGDGYQPSHFEDDMGLGTMDPTLTNGEISLISANDMAVLDLIGYDIIIEPGDADFDGDVDADDLATWGANYTGAAGSGKAWANGDFDGDGDVDADDLATWGANYTGVGGSGSMTTVPEPATMSLLILGSAIVGLRWKK